MPWIFLADQANPVEEAQAPGFRVIGSGPLRRSQSRAAASTARDSFFPGPYRLALTFQDQAQARNAMLLPGAEAATVQIRADDFEEGYRKSLRRISLAGMVGRSQAYQAVVAEQPNAAALRLRCSDGLDERWLNLLPPAAPGGRDSTEALTFPDSGAEIGVHDHRNGQASHLLARREFRG
ncbi:MAG: hypothetical protein ABIG68_01055 [Acidobacteriota bacterium]